MRTSRLLTTTVPRERARLLGLGVGVMTILVLPVLCSCCRWRLVTHHFAAWLLLLCFPRSMLLVLSFYISSLFSCPMMADHVDIGFFHGVCVG